MQNPHEHPTLPDQQVNTPNTLYPGLSDSSIRMLGLREFPTLSEAEEKALFPSVDRYHAYQQIQAETYPARHKRAFKKGIT